MNSGLSDYQDLINTSISGEAINDLTDDLKALSNQVDINTTNIATNTFDIKTNQTNIATNYSLIQINTGQIANNTNNIISNTNSINFLTSSKVSKTGDSMNGDLNFNNLYRVTNLPDPIQSLDGSNKNYVDTKINIVGSSFLKIDGSNSMTGPLNFNNASLFTSPHTPGQLVITASNRIYIQEGMGPISISIESTGIGFWKTPTFYTSTSMNMNRINNLGSPVLPSDASTKDYVDVELTSVKTYLDQKIVDETDRALLVESNIQSDVNNRLPFTGGTMVGDINMNSYGRILNLPLPLSDHEPARKSGLDSALSLISTNTSNIALKLSKAGDTMSGNLSMGLNNITNVGLINGLNITHPF